MSEIIENLSLKTAGTEIGKIKRKLMKERETNGVKLQQKFIVEYWYLTGIRYGESYDYRTIQVVALNEKEALRKARHQAHTKGAKDFKVI